MGNQAREKALEATSIPRRGQTPSIGMLSHRKGGPSKLLLVLKPLHPQTLPKIPTSFRPITKPVMHSHLGVVVSLGKFFF